jgi:hypothetical protein
MVKAGGTSVPEPRTGGGWGAFAIVAPVAAYLVHRISSGDECGWDYGEVGGACRAIILLSVIAGAAAGGLAVAALRAKRADEPRRMRVLAGVAVVVVVLATLAAQQFQDYRHAGMRTMDRANDSR